MADDHLTTKRGRRFFEDNGRLYHFHKLITDGTIETYRCSKYDSDKCPVRIHVKDGEVIKQLNQHTCTSAPAEVAAKRIISQVKARATTTQELPNTLLNNAIADAPQSVLLKLSNKDAIRKIVQRKRNAVAQAPPNPASLLDLIFPEAYQNYEGELFLLIDSGAVEPDAERIVVFGKQSYQTWSGQIEHLFIDGTFSVCPPLFYQLVEILAERSGYVFPIFYALLPNKARRTYDRLFAYIKEIRPLMMPQSIATDFEIALFSSAKDAWPEAEIHGCFFHLHQSIKRKICSEGHKRRYDNEPEFNLWSKCIASLAFVPLDNLEHAFESLTEDMPAKIRDDLQTTLDYFEDNYIGRPLRTKRRIPRFQPAIWSVHNRVLDNQGRTNNYSEAAHRRLHVQLAMDHPTIWKFIDALKAVQKGQDKVYEEFVRGDPPTEKRHRYRMADQRIREIVEDGFERRTVTEYLRAVSNYFSIE